MVKVKSSVTNRQTDQKQYVLLFYWSGGMKRRLSLLLNFYIKKNMTSIRYTTESGKWLAFQQQCHFVQNKVCVKSYFSIIEWVKININYWALTGMEAPWYSKQVRAISLIIETDQTHVLGSKLLLIYNLDQNFRSASTQLMFCVSRYSLKLCLNFTYCTKGYFNINIMSISKICNHILQS